MTLSGANVPEASRVCDALLRALPGGDVQTQLRDAHFLPGAALLLFPVGLSAQAGAVCGILQTQNWSRQGHFVEIACLQRCALTYSCL